MREDKRDVDEFYHRVAAIEKFTPLVKDYINRVSSSQDYLGTLKVLLCCANRHGLGLSDEILFIIIAQGATKP